MKFEDWAIQYLRDKEGIECYGAELITNINNLKKRIAKRIEVVAKLYDWGEGLEESILNDYFNSGYEESELEIKKKEEWEYCIQMLIHEISKRIKKKNAIQNVFKSIVQQCDFEIRLNMKIAEILSDSKFKEKLAKDLQIVLSESNYDLDTKKNKCVELLESNEQFLAEEISEGDIEIICKDLFDRDNVVNIIAKSSGGIKEQIDEKLIRMILKEIDRLSEGSDWKNHRKILKIYNRMEDEIIRDDEEEFLERNTMSQNEREYWDKSIIKMDNKDRVKWFDEVSEEECVLYELLLQIIPDGRGHGLYRRLKNNDQWELIEKEHVDDIFEKLSQVIEHNLKWDFMQDKLNMIYIKMNYPITYRAVKYQYSLEREMKKLCDVLGKIVLTQNKTIDELEEEEEMLSEKEVAQLEYYIATITKPGSFGYREEHELRYNKKEIEWHNQEKGFRKLEQLLCDMKRIRKEIVEEINLEEYLDTEE